MLTDENCAALGQENQLLGKGKHLQYDGKLPGCEIRPADSLFGSKNFSKGFLALCQRKSYQFT